MRLLCSLSIFLFLTACAQPGTDDIRVENGWVAEVPPVIKVTAALMVLHNDGDSPKYLVEASSPIAEIIEIHRSIVVDDLARMIKQQEVEIPPRGSVEFSNETGYHLMLYETDKIKAGDKVPFTLRFKDGSSLDTVYEVLDRRERF